MSKGLELYLIQSPAVVRTIRDGGDPEYNEDLLKAYSRALAIEDIDDFIVRVEIEAASRQKRISKLIIGSHGYVTESQSAVRGAFWISRDKITLADKDKINRLIALRNYFAKGAQVYIMTCRTGQDGMLLQQVSGALGGVAVYGYTNWIVTTNYGLFATVDKQVGSAFENKPNGEPLKGAEVICWPTVCAKNPFVGWADSGGFVDDALDSLR